MKRYRVKLVRRLDQSAVVAVDAENASDAAHAGIKMVPLFWRTDVTEDTYYESVTEIVAVEPEPEKEADPTLPEDNEGEEKQIFETFYQCYECELDISYDGGDLVSSCFITRGDYGSSLAFADANGVIEDHNTGEQIPIPDRVVATIHKWAEENGY